MNNKLIKQEQHTKLRLMLAFSRRASENQKTKACETLGVLLKVNTCQIQLFYQNRFAHF